MRLLVTHPESHVFRRAHCSGGVEAASSGSTASSGAETCSAVKPKPMRLTKNKSGTGTNKRPAKRELGAHQQRRKLRREAAPERPGGSAGPLEPQEVSAAKRIRKEQAEKEEKAPPRGQKRGGGDGGFEYPTVRLRFDSGAGARAPETGPPLQRAGPGRVAKSRIRKLATITRDVKF